MSPPALSGQGAPGAGTGEARVHRPDRGEVGWYPSLVDGAVGVRNEEQLLDVAERAGQAVASLVASSVSRSKHEPSERIGVVIGMLSELAALRLEFSYEDIPEGQEADREHAPAALDFARALASIISNTSPLLVDLVRRHAPTRRSELARQLHAATENLRDLRTGLAFFVGDEAELEELGVEWPPPPAAGLRGPTVPLADVLADLGVA